jgi:hypothetical protein
MKSKAVILKYHKNEIIKFIKYKYEAALSLDIFNIFRDKKSDSN